MDIKPWKKQKRTGAMKRKLRKAYSQCESAESLTEHGTCEQGQPSYEMSALPSCQKGSVQTKLKHGNNTTITTESTNFGLIKNKEGPVQFELRNLYTDQNRESTQKNCLQISETDSSSDEDEAERNLYFRNEIKKWAIDKNVSQVALKDLAEIINNRFPELLPKDPRTILHTATNVSIKSLDVNSQYWHNGLVDQLEFFFDNLKNVPNTVSLIINFDGLPIFRSSKNEFWPILCAVHEYPGLQPLVIGIYYGSGKPKNLDIYLEDFITEMKKLLNDGVYHKQSSKTITIKIRCFVCDSPARAFIKGVSNFNSKNGCLKCTTLGEYSHTSHTVVFPQTRCSLRSDDDFRKKHYGQHHKADSPLLKLPIDMINDFPVADCLHLIDLGVMKRLLIGWRDGNFGKYVTKWSSKDIDAVQMFLRKCKLPSEIHRSVRGVDCLAHWKASEYRTFFLYLSIIILPDVLTRDALIHFQCLYCAITICSSEIYKNLLPLAKNLLQYFVEHYKDFYGPDYVTSNVHNLLHLTDEVQRFGPLQTFSAYPFENKLSLIKRLLRGGNKPLSQVAKRLGEAAHDVIINFVNKYSINNNLPRVSKNGDKRKIYFRDFVLSTKHRDKYFMTRDDKIVEIRLITEEINLHCNIFTGVSEVFEYPVKSSLFSIFKCKLNDCRCTTETILHMCDVKFKLVCLEHNRELYFIPLLHTV